VSPEGLAKLRADLAIDVEFLRLVQLRLPGIILRFELAERANLIPMQPQPEGKPA
jgi:hypothetical protein